MIRWMRELTSLGKGALSSPVLDMQTPAVTAQIVSTFFNRSPGRESSNRIRVEPADAQNHRNVHQWRT